jgi:transcription elongation factor Elf1
MLWIDTKYANLVSSSLERFKVKQFNPYLANFRCPICGDSQKNKFKARGFLYTKTNSLFYKCHNCGAGTTFNKFLEGLNSDLYKQYTLEKYKEGAGNNKPKSTIKFKQPTFTKKNILDSKLQRLDKLPKDNIAIKYCESRGIPTTKYKHLYFVDNVQKLEDIHEKYKDRVLGEEPRLVIPYYKDDQLVGLTCRALGNESLRYLTLRVDDNLPLIYNIDNVDIDRIIYVTEGPIDSLFLDNSVAVSNADLKKVSNYFPKDKLVLVFDNEPRNEEIVKIINKAIEDKFKVVIWPTFIKEKDINDMQLSKINYKELIKNNTYSGLTLQLNFNKWKRI